MPAGVCKPFGIVTTNVQIKSQFINDVMLFWGIFTPCHAFSCILQHCWSCGPEPPLPGMTSFMDDPKCANFYSIGNVRIVLKGCTPLRPAMVYMHPVKTLEISVNYKRCGRFVKNTKNAGDLPQNSKCGRLGATARALT